MSVSYEAVGFRAEGMVSISTKYKQSKSRQKHEENLFSGVLVTAFLLCDSTECLRICEADLQDELCE